MPQEAAPDPARRARAPRRGSKALAALAGVWTLAGCSGVAFVNAVEPSTGVKVESGLRYAEGPRGGVDVYRPLAAAGAPVVIFLYGGSWDSGRRGDYAFVGRALARDGFVAVVPDYRVFPEVRWPSFLEDNAEALAWARTHAPEFGGDPKKLFLLGHSAGAYNVAMLTLDRRWLASVGLDPSRDLRGAIGLAGPYDFLPLHSEELKTIFGPEDGRPATQPINYVDGRSPPMLLGVDLGDKVVDPGNTARLAARIRAAGGPVETKAYKGLSHGLLIGVFAGPLQVLAPVRRDVAAFIRTRASSAGP